MFTLFPHNLEAYQAASSMLAEKGRAAVIHPTGTGKSFIAFRLVMDHQESSVLWIGPSEYIFRTQVDNLARNGAPYPGNLSFMTYAKLMFMDDEEISKLDPDYIIFDEFHRAGAEQWGIGVNRLLTAYGDVPLLGLSATNIRYLDNQRDMAEEIFCGNVASEMTLGEAIARGILAAPKYVISVFSMEKQLEQLQERIRKTRSAAVRDAAQNYLDALRRALDRADGLDVVFRRHMQDRAGKYLVFCSDVDHLHAVEKMLPKWMSQVDDDPHIYAVYSDNPETSKAFAEFRLDRSKHVKLLCCIDMLNEGIHIDDVNGVILVRPTVSPIIYKQQIGRALSASKSIGTPIIFDLVNNFENLYSVGMIEEEMETAAALYDFRTGDGDGVVIRDRFEISDEVRECREIFESLNETLTASWDIMFGKAKEWFEEHRDLNIPCRYFTPEGYSLGRWLQAQKWARSEGKLDDTRIRKLDEIGITWKNVYEESWDRFMKAARQYRDAHGDLDVPSNYVTPDGLKLGNWLTRIRQAKSGTIIRVAKLTPKRIEELESVGMIWNKTDYHLSKYMDACAQYYAVHRNLRVPHDYVTDKGLPLGTWIARVRSHHEGKVKYFSEISEDTITQLEAYGIEWSSRKDALWENGFSHLMTYKEAHGETKVPNRYVCEDGFALGQWYFNLRRSKLTNEQKARLDAEGVVYRRVDSWEYRYSLVRRYYDEHHTLVIPSKLTVEGVNLSKWISDQRRIYAGKWPGKELRQDQVERLDTMGMNWELRKADPWEDRYSLVKQYFDEHHTLKIPGGLVVEGVKLLAWINTQRRIYAGKYPGKMLRDDQIERLEAMGISWELRRTDAWDYTFALVKRYFDENHTLEIPSGVIVEGIRLKRWLDRQRGIYAGRYAGKSLREDQIKRLESIGISWTHRTKS